LPDWTIFLDTNTNGQLDPGETSVQTDTNGSYRFIDLRPGTYTVAEVPQSDWQPTFPGSTTSPSAHTTTLAPGQIVENLDFGSQQVVPSSASLGDRLWHDLNANGIQDTGEPGLQGFTINLYNTSDELLDSTVTDQSGNYNFTNLLPGDYTVEIAPTIDFTVIPDPAFYLSPQNQGDDDTLDSDFDPISRSVSVTLSDGEDLQTLDAGLYRYANIYGQIFNDIDGNGQLEVGEAGLADWTVYLDPNNNGLLDEGEQSTQTSSNGSYAFYSLVPGTYTVAQVLRPNWQQTFPTEGALSTTVELSSFELIENLNFGNQNLSQNPILSTNTGLTLNEGSNTTITPSQLRVTDADSTAANLTYTLLNPPTMGNLLLNSSPLKYPGTFTQADIDNNRLSYTHNGSETTSDSFSFTVADETGNVIGTTDFQITINPVAYTPIRGSIGGGTRRGTDGADSITGYHQSVGIALRPGFTKTFGRDIILAGAGDDIIVGGFNSDRLTGGEGRDRFVYNTPNDAADIITDFTPGTDKIVLTNLLKSVGYQGSDPIGDGYVTLRSWGQSGTSSYVQIDSDGSSGLRQPHILLLAQNVNLASLNNVNNFEF
jgi:protocatechuate 3,4-dioxygenase beta subunit